MIRKGWIVDVRNKLSDIYEECNSYPAIEESKLTVEERDKLKSLIKKAMYYIDAHLPKIKMK